MTTGQKVWAVAPIVLMVAGAWAAFKGSDNTHADSSQYSPAEYMALGSGQMWLGIVMLAGGAGWGAFNVLKGGGSTKPIIPSSVVGDDPAFANIAKAIEETTKHTADQLDAMKKEHEAKIAAETAEYNAGVAAWIKARDERVATLKSIKPGGML